MKPFDMRLTYAAVLFVLVIASGFWVAKLGRPLHAGVLAVHKLLALACLVLMIIIVRALAKGAVLNPLIITLITLTFVFFIVMIATGGMLGFEKTRPEFVKLTHKIVPYLTLAASAVTVYLLKG
jgi:hypothetical protein